MSQYLDDGPTGQHRPVGLVNAIAMQKFALPAPRKCYRRTGSHDGIIEDHAGPQRPDRRAPGLGDPEERRVLPD